MDKLLILYSKRFFGLQMSRVDLKAPSSLSTYDHLLKSASAISRNRSSSATKHRKILAGMVLIMGKQASRVAAWLHNLRGENAFGLVFQPVDL